MSTPGTIVQVEQGTLEWKEVRCGIVTASRFADVMDFTKKGEGADRKKYRSELISEILTGVPYPRYESWEMRWGREQEQFARSAYEIQNDVLVETPGFIKHATIARFGGSPDGSVDKGGIQIKCPNTTTHLNWLLAGTVPIEHAPQMAAEMSAYGWDWEDFVSFDPRLPEHLQLFVRRWERNEHIIASVEKEVVQFNAEIDQVLVALPQKPQGVLIAMDQMNADEMEF
jgi:YqaJ-like viral recombinase domain